MFHSRESWGGEEKFGGWRGEGKGSLCQILLAVLLSINEAGKDRTANRAGRRVIHKQKLGPRAGEEGGKWGRLFVIKGVGSWSGLQGGMEVKRTCRLGQPTAIGGAGKKPGKRRKGIPKVGYAA